MIQIGLNQIINLREELGLKFSRLETRAYLERSSGFGLPYEMVRKFDGGISR